MSQHDDTTQSNALEDMPFLWLLIVGGGLFVLGICLYKLCQYCSSNATTVGPGGTTEKTYLAPHTHDGGSGGTMSAPIGNNVLTGEKAQQVNDDLECRGPF